MMIVNKMHLYKELIADINAASDNCYNPIEWVAFFWIVWNIYL